MKKLCFLICILLFNVSLAYEPAITKFVLGSKAFDCKEVVFISGEPIVFEGTLEYKESGKGEKITETYNYKLESEAGDSLNRQLTFLVSSETKANQQTIKKWELTKYSESMKIGSDTYTLVSYNISRNQIDDKKPIGAYFAGHINVEKEYEKDEEKIRVIGSGDIYGYDTVWAKNETAYMTYTISNRISKNNSWMGKFSTTISNTDQKKIRYIKNKPTEISFNGSYVMVENNVSSMRYSSEMPEFYNSKATDYIINEEEAYKYESFPVETRLVDYSINGVKGHWGEEDIKKAFSLEFMDEWERGTTPDAVVTRGEFAKILAKAIKIQIPEYKDNEVIYKDVSVNNKYYSYIRALSDAGVVKGTGNLRFSPNSSINRAEAVTMIINAIGFENKTPEPIPTLDFSDSHEIPVWALKYIYMADKIGIVSGNDKGEFMPGKQLTKAEIASICNRLISYLTEELSEEYVK